MTAETSNLFKLNEMDQDAFQAELFRCSGSNVWTLTMTAARPYKDSNDFLRTTETSWNLLSREDWLQAFKIHPKIGDIDNLRKKYASTAEWAADEQAGTSAANESVLKSLAAGNSAYEQKFGYIFIVCATGKTAIEMLEILESRLLNEAEIEFKIACEEQKKITNLRLDKLQL